MRGVRHPSLRDNTSEASAGGLRGVAPPHHCCDLPIDTTCQGLFAAVVGDRTGDGDVEQTRSDHLDPGHEVFDCGDHRLETSDLVTEVTEEDGGEGGEGLRLPPGHAQGDPGGEDFGGGAGDAVVDYEYRLIRRRVWPGQRPHRKPHAQRPYLHLPPRNAG